MEIRCPNCSNNTDQVPIGMNLSSDIEVYKCEKCHAHYGIILFDSREDADEYTEVNNGEVL